MQVLIYKPEQYTFHLVKGGFCSAPFLDTTSTNAVAIVKAGEPIQQYRAVAILNKQAYYADNENLLQVTKPIGVALNNAQVGENVRVLLQGRLIIPNFFVPEQPLYVGKNGLIVQALPSSVKYIKKLGIAVTNNEAVIVQFEPIIVVE